MEGERGSEGGGVTEREGGGGGGGGWEEILAAIWAGFAVIVVLCRSAETTLKQFCRLP